MGPPITPADRLGMTLFFAIVAHAIFILGVVFAPHERTRTETSTLDVVLVQHAADKAPEEVEFLAQANQEGGGEEPEKARPSSPLPTPLVGKEATVVAAAPPVEAAPLSASFNPPVPKPRPSPTERTPKPILAQTRTPTQTKVAKQAPEKPKAPERRKPTETDTEPVPEPEKPSPEAPEAVALADPTTSLNASTLVTRSLAMASLSAEIDSRLKAYAARPKRKWISVRTREYKYASYMEAWRAKVERIGNLNYPDEARRNRLSGSLLLEVALNPNGTINDIVLRRSSGHRVLDDAAIRIVKLAAPFAPLPKHILEETDILHIERTWRFLSSNQFASN